jgi:hypothetical protein
LIEAYVPFVVADLLVNEIAVYLVYAMVGLSGSAMRLHLSAASEGRGVSLVLVHGEAVLRVEKGVLPLGEDRLYILKLIA